MIDIETSRLIAVENISASDNKRTVADLKRAPLIDKDVLYRNCLAKIKDEFRKIVAPYDIKVEVSFETDKALPEVDQAILLLKVGNWSDGLELFERATQKPGLKRKVRAKAYFDLGLAQMYSDQCDLAIETLQQALILHPKTKYEKAIKKAQGRKSKIGRVEKTAGWLINEIS